MSYNHSRSLVSMFCQFVRLNEHARPPVFMSFGAAGADLSSAEKCVVLAKGKRLISTGLQVAIPPKFYGRIAARSGLALNHFIDVGAGVIDADYRGEVKVLLFNFGEQDFEINIGDRIAQLICESYARPIFLEVDVLDETKRGANGFGASESAWDFH